MLGLPAIWVKVGRIGLGVAALLTLGLLGPACGGEAVAPTPAPAPVAAAGTTTTPTPMPDPDAILAETAANLRQAGSFRFEVDHEAGAIYVRTVQAKAVKAKGAWNGEQGADMTVDAYLVSGPDVPPTEGTYVELNLAVTADSYFITDPLSGVWTKRPLETIPIPITELNSIMAGFIDDTANATLVGEEEVDDAPTYKITGDAPATVMGWLLLTPEEGQRVDVEIWTDTEAKILRQARVIGAIGSDDAADTVRRVLVTDYNAEVEIETPGPDDVCLDLQDPNAPDNNCFD